MMFSSGGPRTMEQRVEALEDHLTAIRNEWTNMERALYKRMDEHKSETARDIAENRAALVSLVEKVKQTAVGGLMQQIFGVLLASYGIWLGAFAQP